MQTEQSATFPQRGGKWLNYFRRCHGDPLCAIWDFSQANWQWLQDRGVGNSVVIMPILMQNRLGFTANDNLTALPNRPTDIVCFATMTRRRKIFFDQIWNSSSHFNISWRVAHTNDNVRQGYLDSKICLVLHSYSADSAAEFHRLSELVSSGCVPVMESWSEDYSTVSEPFATCGGVVLANLTNLEAAWLETLHSINNASLDTFASLEWWRRGIQWPTFLKRVFEVGLK